MNWRRVLSHIAAVLILATACGSETVETSPGSESGGDTSGDERTQAVEQPPAPEIEQALTLSPRSVSAGAEVSVTSTILGGWFDFSIWNGSEWEPTVGALQAAEVRGGALTIPLGQDFNIDDFGLDSPATIVVPEDAMPGNYRLCTFGNADRCGTLEVTN